MYTTYQRRYIESVGGDAHQSAIDIIGMLERAIIRTIKDNLHLADGDNCTLRPLTFVVDLRECWDGKEKETI